MDNGKTLRRAATACAIALALTAMARAQEGDGQKSDAPSVAQQCLNNPSIKRTKVLSNRNIIFVTRDDRIYNNQLPRQCPSLKRGSLVNYAVEHSRLCAGGAFQVLWELGPGNFTPAFVCHLGNFVPITEAELEDLTIMTEKNRARRSARRSTREAVTTEQVELPPAESE